MVGPEQAHLATALREGTIPVILLQAVETAQRQSRISCGVEAYDDGTEYVAISHVWADGHGNPHDNALPSCFLEKLVELVELLPNAKQESGVKVWLDTLCVPRGDLKQLALSRLKEPYMWAKHVLVLDSYLCSLTSACMSPLEVVARIRTSSWTQRLWTFKEGRLSGEHLWFQFQDQAINLFDLIQNVWRKEWSFLPTIAENAIHTSVLYNYTSSKIWDFEDMYWALDDITTLRGELVARTSSHSEDEGICLANIMELDIGPILRAPIQDRMKVFWSLQHRVPLGMALSSAKQKLTCPGYRWAPASLMGDSGTPHWSGPLDGNEVDAEPTSAGLLVDMFAYSIYPVEHDYQTFLRPEDSKTQGIRILQGENENLLWWMVRDKMANWYRCLLQGDWHQNQAPIDPEKDFAILVMEEIQPRAHRAAEQVGHLSFTKGIVVSYTAPADKCQPILAKAHRHVEVKQLAPSDSKLQEQLWTTALQIMTSVIKTGGHLSPDFRTIFQSTRKDALSQLVADSEFLHLSKRVNATWGGDFDGEELVGHLEWEIYRFMMCSSWIGIRMVSEKSTWCID
ncbi:hypothetical protein NX059_011969 [Plenodomus lindquistii]|nr:hypothetical protein NX059_011969 [Plenodomus lindquistii]